LITFIQLPLFGADFNHVGNIAKRVKGAAKASAKPNIPIVGAITEPLVTISTNSRPIMGPVQLKETNTNVNAMKKILSRPVVLEAFSSIALLHEEGSVISNPPRKEAANTTNKAKRKRLNTAFVLRALREEGPQIIVTSSPNATYMTTMLRP
jgi:hypothetical protein